MCGSGGHNHPNQHEDNPAAGDFPADLYPQLTDAHCHIQDDRENIRRLVQSWATHSSNPSNDLDACSPLLTGKVCLMGVQPSKDLRLQDKAVEETEQVSEAEQDNETEQDATMAEKTASLSLNSSSVPSSSTTVVTVTWNDTDTKGDWDLVSELAHAYPDRFVPCFGIHPWFTHKYKAMETSSGPALELRRSGGGANTKPDTPMDASSSPSLSFSANELTSVSGPSVRYEDFLAMSKQLQEQMAKEGQPLKIAREEAKHASLTPDEESALLTSISETGNRNHKNESAASRATQERDPVYTHYRSVLGLPASAPESYLAELAQRLPKPRALEPAMLELRRKLEEHPHAVLGEIGLDRIARVPEPSLPSTMTLDTSEEGEGRGEEGSAQVKKEQLLQQKKTTLALTSIQHQLEIVREQLKIAASLNRAVSFHCVQAYGHWHDFLIQEGKRVKQREAHKEYQQQLQEIQAAGGTSAFSPISATGLPLSKRSAAKLKREARDAAWERHVASTLQESSDEGDSDEEQEGSQGSACSGPKTNSQDPNVCQDSGPVTSETTDVILTPLPPYEPVLPPRLCMHSYGGSVDMLKAFTKMDHAPEIFFSFSILINGRLQERKLRELILAVPEDRLLIESDHHSHSQVDQLLVEMVHKVAEIREWTLKETVEKAARNWNRFVYG
ncbi:hypothetical protein BGZ70_003322 [Mortierella alpina]|uniref:Cut9 interacting protein Scn1 n=1 Tax=Mortierella alpina TaxID=64518 RepID=A0A9P6JAT9_MORAP|nr:hypothetical protein BGZ70_003322 [Mortierella alpina]